MLILILGLAGIICFGMYVSLLTRNVLWGWGSLLVVTWYDIAFRQSSGLLGSFHVAPTDIVTVALLIAGILRFSKRLSESSSSQTIIVCYLALFLFSLARGVIEYGVKLAGNESRALVWPIIGLLYFFTIPRDEETIRKFVLFYIYCAGALFCVGLLAYLGFHVGGVALDADASDERYLPASAACQIGISCVFLLAWISHHRSRRWMYWAAASFFAMAILLRTRSVWILLLSVFAAVPFIDWKMFRKVVPMLFVGAASTVVLGLVLYSNQGELSTQLQSSASQTNTLEWRFQGWIELLSDKDQTPFSVLFGNAFGGGFVHLDPLSSRYTDAPPHNEYVMQFLRLGIPGLVLSFLMLIRPIYLFNRSQSLVNKSIFPSTSAWRLVCIGLLAFGVTYSITIDGWAFIAVANALLLDRNKKARSSDVVLNGDVLLSSSSAA
jgi:O-antigen ligase